MSNEEIAIEIQKGNISLYPKLWGQVQRFIRSVSRRYYENYSERCAACGVTVDDLHQEGFFALCEAVKAYKPESGFKLLTFLKYPFKNRFKMLIGARTGKKEPLNYAEWIEKPIGETEDDIKLLDTLEDTSAAADYIEAERRIFSESLHRELLSVYTRFLTVEETEVITRHYIQGETYTVIAENLGVTAEKARQIKNKAFRKIREGNTKLQKYSDGVVSAAYGRGGLFAFKNTGTSSTEWAALKMIHFKERGGAVEQ